MEKPFEVTLVCRGYVQRVLALNSRASGCSLLRFESVFDEPFAVLF